MHRFALALVPLALLTACGSEEPTPDAPAVGTPSELATEETDLVQVPDPTADGVDTVDYSGSYTFIDVDGSRSTLTLDKDAGTYEYVSPDGTTEGKYRRLDAGRIAIEDFDGTVGYFSIAPGAVYRLSGAGSPYDEIDLGRMYRRSDYTIETGPGVATSSAIATGSLAPGR